MVELVRKKGIHHEKEVLARLEARYGAAVRVPDKGSPIYREAATLAAIKDGAPLIYHGALTRSLWLGYPDFLVRKDSENGTTVIEPEDAKLGRKAKGEYVLQLGVYAELLQHLIGNAVGSGTIHVRGDAPKRFDLRQIKYILERLMRKFETFVVEKQSTRPVPCAACTRCDYKARCETEWRSGDSLYFVAGLTTGQAIKLDQAGVRTLAELAKCGESLKASGIATETISKLVAQARLQLRARETGEEVVELLPLQQGRGFHLLPAPNAGDLYFDMEGDPFYEQGLEYLFGIWAPVGEGEAYGFRPIWANDHIEEKAAFEELMRLFISHFQHHPNAHIYHYAQYEPNALKRLAMRYATMEAELDQLLRTHRFVDLHRVVRQALRASTESYSLKDLKKIYWLACAGDVTTGEDCIVEYERWCLTREDAILESIAEYNKGDCESIAHMHQWLESLRPAGVEYDVREEESVEKALRAADRAELEARKQALAARIRAASTGDEHLRDTVAEFLWFHYRAQKPLYWALFERQTWSDEELIDDAESLGALVRDASVPPRPVKRSIETTYSFPPQDTKLKVGDTPKIAETLAYAGKIVDIAPEEGRVVLRRGASSCDHPLHFSLLTAPIGLHGLPDAVIRFGERFAAGDLLSNSALIDFLLRRPPRLKNRKFGAPILNAGEGLVAGTIRAAMDLHGSYLFVQGPPGTGKTYTMSEVIPALLSVGYRVGVSSNSHKAINKVLEDVEERVSKTGQRFIGVKKGIEDVSDTEFNSPHIETVYRSEDVAPFHRLVGGTAYHFCREDQQGAYDYLIVDEAGQVSLGNLVAMAGAARNIILTGDQMQLPQPVQGVHPGETGFSSLEYLLHGHATVPPELGIFLNETWRLHPDLCRFISEAVYDGRLNVHPNIAERHLVVTPGAHAALRPSGLVFVSVEHEGCTQSCIPEAETIANLIDQLLQQQIHRDKDTVNALTLEDVLIVAPYNMQVHTLRQRLPAGAKVGTVDKFQGQEAPVVILSMTTSHGEDAPHGTGFLFSRNRFNVAISRAQCLAIVVHGKDLLEGDWRHIEDLQRLNLFARAEAAARRVVEPKLVEEFA